MSKTWHDKRLEFQIRHDKRLEFHKTSRVLCIKDNMYYSLWGYTWYTCSYFRLIIVLLEVGTVTSRGTIHYPKIRPVKIHAFHCCVFMWPSNFNNVKLQLFQETCQTSQQMIAPHFCSFVNHIAAIKIKHTKRFQCIISTYNVSFVVEASTTEQKLTYVWCIFFRKMSWPM